MKCHRPYEIGVVDVDKLRGDRFDVVAGGLIVALEHSPHSQLVAVAGGEADAVDGGPAAGVGQRIEVVCNTLG